MELSTEKADGVCNMIIPSLSVIASITHSDEVARRFDGLSCSEIHANKRDDIDTGHCHMKE